MSASSLRTLASTLDDLVSSGALVSESPDALVVSELSATHAHDVAQALDGLSWSPAIFDRANTETAAEDLHDSFGPFRVSARKPVRDDETTLVVTAAGFVDMLLGEQGSGVAAVVRLEHPITLEGIQFIPVDGVAAASEEVRSFRSPRTLVREYGTTRTVPASIGRWLLVDPSTWHDKDERFRLWASHAVLAILPALPTEIDQNNKAYVFRGPPRLALEPLSIQQDIFDGLGHDGFQNLQASARWIYELDREAENRHTLFATEFARTGSAGANTLECLRDNIGHALEGAKIAHAMSVAKVSADNLKALADLRKAVTDETGKIADAVRQVVGAIASALAIGIGLIAARVAANAPGPLVLAVIVVVAAYIFVVIYSGHKFAALQRGLRDMWRSQIYRFLSQDEYQKLVIQPSLDAEKILTKVSWIGGIAVAATFAVAAWVALMPLAASPDKNMMPEPAPVVIPVAPDVTPENPEPKLAPETQLQLPQQKEPELAPAESLSLAAEP